MKAAYRQNQKGGGSSQNPPKSAPNLNLPLQKCYNCGQTGHKSTNCGVRQQQQQQQQQQYRTQGTAPTAQNQNWGPSNQNYGNSQSNQSNMRNSGQSGNTGYGRGGNNNQGYNNNTRNSGHNNNYQQTYSNPPRGQSNYSSNQQNRPANFGNRQPQYQQGPQTGYGVRALQINSDGWNEGCENGGNFDNPEREFFENGEQCQYMPNCQEQENFFSSEYSNNQDGRPTNHNCINSQSASYTPLTTTAEKNQNTEFGRGNDMRNYDTGTSDTRTSNYSTGTSNYDPRTSAYRAGTREYDNDQYNSPGEQHFQNGA
ncbi:MAG: hypothetical protein GY821_04185, partial [Gammaproteobacteria bacterium]|nr:hypothetical protein [Gammaproteobacteria bacterium]